MAAVLLNARYGPIGISVAPSMHGNVVSRFLRAQLVVDETWRRRLTAGAATT